MPGTAGLDAGAPVVGVVRPERCLPDAGTITVGGRVADVSFVGPAIYINLDPDAPGVELHAAVSGNATDVERATAFGFEPEDVWLVPGG